MSKVPVMTLYFPRYEVCLPNKVLDELMGHDEFNNKLKNILTFTSESLSKLIIKTAIKYGIELSDRDEDVPLVQYDLFFKTPNKDQLFSGELADAMIDGVEVVR